MPTYTFDHIHLRSADVPAAAKFYQDLFGATPTGRTHTDGRIDLAIGGSKLFISPVAVGDDPSGDPRPSGVHHFAFTVPDIAAAAKHLKDHGVRFETEVKSPRPGTQIAFVWGPDKVLIEIIQRG